MTVLDLLVGIAILIILAGVAIVAGQQARTRAYNTQALVCGEQIRKAQTLYYSENQRFADAMDKLDDKMVARCALVNVATVTATAAGYTYTVAHARGNATYTIEDDRAGVSLLAGGNVNGTGAEAGPPEVTWPTTPIPAGQGRVNLVLYGNIPAGRTWYVRDSLTGSWTSCPASPCTLTRDWSGAFTLYGSINTTYPGTSINLGPVLYQPQVIPASGAAMAEQYSTASWGQTVTPVIGQTITVAVKASMLSGGLILPLEAGRSTVGSGGNGPTYVRAAQPSDAEPILTNHALGLMNLVGVPDAGDCSTPEAQISTAKAGISTCAQMAQVTAISGNQYRVLSGLHDGLVHPTTCTDLFRIRNGGHHSADQYNCAPSVPVRPVIGQWTVLDPVSTYQGDTFTVRLTPASNIDVDKVMATDQILNLAVKVLRSSTRELVVFNVKGIRTTRVTRVGNALEYVVELPRLAAGLPYVLNAQDGAQFYSGAGCAFRVNVSGDVAPGGVLNGTITNDGAATSCP